MRIYHDSIMGLGPAGCFAHLVFCLVWQGSKIWHPVVSTRWLHVVFILARNWVFISGGKSCLVPVWWDSESGSRSLDSGMAALCHWSSSPFSWTEFLSAAGDWMGSGIGNHIMSGSLLSPDDLVMLPPMCFGGGLQSKVKARCTLRVAGEPLLRVEEFNVFMSKRKIECKVDNWIDLVSAVTQSI